MTRDSRRSQCISEEAQSTCWSELLPCVNAAASIFSPPIPSFDHLGRRRKKELPLSCWPFELQKRANFYVSRHPCSDSALFGKFRFSWLCSFFPFCATLPHSPHSNQRRPFTERLSACSFPLLLFRNAYYAFISSSPFFSSETTCYLICTRTSCKQRHGTSGGSCNGCLSRLASPKKSKVLVLALPWIIIPSYYVGTKLYSSMYIGIRTI